MVFGAVKNIAFIYIVIFYSKGIFFTVQIPKPSSGGRIKAPWGTPLFPYVVR